ADAPLLPPGFVVPVPPDTVSRYGSPGQLPTTVAVECGSPWLHSPPRSCRPPISSLLAPIPLPHTGARFVQIVPRTASTPETVRAGFLRTWNDAGSPDRNPNP